MARGRAEVKPVIAALGLRAALPVRVVRRVRKEGRNIAGLLDSLVVQEPPFEIIVVDSASQDATRDIVRRYERQYESVHLYIYGGQGGGRRDHRIRGAEGEASGGRSGGARAGPGRAKGRSAGLWGG